MTIKQSGFTLVEVTMAVALGIILVLGGTLAYGGYMTSAKYNKAKLMLSTIRTAIETERMRTGSYPPSGAVTSKGTIQSNTTKNNKAFYAGSGGLVQGDCNKNGTIDAAESNLPCDPFLNKSTVTAGTSPGGPPSVGGWLYDAPTGQFKINLLDSEYGHPPNGSIVKLEENASAW